MKVRRLIVAGLLAISVQAQAACWDAAFDLSTRGGTTGVTDLTVEWTPLRAGRCSTELAGFDHYRVELGTARALTARGDGAVIARIYDRDTPFLRVQGLSANTTVYMAVYVCDSNGDCLDSDDMDNHTLSSTTGS